jgi:hypothetical protein
MINLLPHDTKQTLVFARHNTYLIRAIIGLAIGLAVLAVVVAGSYFVLQQQANDYDRSIKEAEASLKAQNEAATIKRVQEISNSLTLVVDVLEEEILFSELLRQVGAVMPSGTALQNLSLSGGLSGAIDLQAVAIDYNSGSQVQINLEDPANQIFAKADLVGIDCNGREDLRYPCIVTLRAQFSDDNDFKLLSTSRKATNE